MSGAPFLSQKRESDKMLDFSGKYHYTFFNSPLYSPQERAGMKKKDSKAETMGTESDILAGQSPVFPGEKRRHPAVYLLIAASLAVLIITGVILFVIYPGKDGTTSASITFKTDDTVIYKIEAVNPSIKKRFNRIVVKWENPSDSNFKEVAIQKEKGSIKTLLYRGTGRRFVFKDYDIESTYRIICINTEGYFSKGIILELSGE